jgi:hypothetical protein
MADFGRLQIVEDQLPAVEARPFHQKPFGYNTPNRAEQIQQVVVIQLLRHCGARFGEP